MMEHLDYYMAQYGDGVSDILNRLLEVINVRYLVFLYADDGSSPHTLNMVDFEDQKLINDKNIV